MHQNDTELNKNNNQWNYISVIFENTYYPFDCNRILEDSSFRNEVYGRALKYTYKVKDGEINNLVEGRVLSINNRDKVSRVLVTNIGLKESDITFPIDKIKELPLYKGE